MILNGKNWSKTLKIWCPNVKTSWNLEDRDLNHSGGEFLDYFGLLWLKSHGPKLNWDIICFIQENINNNKNKYTFRSRSYAKKIKIIICNMSVYKVKPYLFAHPNPINAIISWIISWQTITIFLFYMVWFAN